jgi:hypothetical protein
MKNISLQIKCIKNPLEAIHETLEIAKAIKGTVWLSFEEFNISISHESNPHDLWEIYTLNVKLVDSKK